MKSVLISYAVLHCAAGMAQTIKTDPGPFMHYEASPRASQQELNPLPPRQAPSPEPGSGPSSPKQGQKSRFGGVTGAMDLPVAEDGACPPKVEIPLDCDYRCRRRLLRGAAARQIVLREVPVFEDVGLERRQGGSKLSFGDRVKVTHWSRSRLGSHFVRYDTERGPRCGWVDPDAVLSERRGSPMRISELGAEGIADFKLSGKGSELDAKVLVRNEYEKGNADAGDGARVYYRFTDPEPHSTIRIFSVLNVYDYARHEGEVWYFVGGTRTTKSKGEEQVLYGWVRADEVIPWSTPVNVYYAEGKTGLEIYETDRDAEAKTNAFARQGRGEIDLADGLSGPRFPLLATSIPQDAALHEIAFPGIACDRDGDCASGRNRVTGEALPTAAMLRGSVGEPLSRDVSELKDFFEPGQLVRRGFVRQSDPADPDWRYWIAFKPAHMREIVLAGQELCETLSDDPPDPENVRAAMVAILKSIAGDSPEEPENLDETLRRFLSKRLQVPVDHLPALLDKNSDGFVQWYMESKRSESEAFKVLMCKKAALLESAVNGQRVDGELDDIELDPGTNTWGPREGSARNFSWWWSSEHGIGFYYVPLDYIL